MAWTLEEALSYYRSQGAPGDQNALVNLMKEIQAEHGGAIPRHIPARIGACYGVKESYLLAVIRRFPSLRLADSHVLELCGGPNCGKRTELAALAEQLCRNKPGIQLKFVPCMRLCGKGPNLRWDGTLYHKADEALLRRLTESV